MFGNLMKGNNVDIVAQNYIKNESGNVYEDNNLIL